MIASSIDFLDDAVELILTGPAPARLVVFDFIPRSTTSARRSTPRRPAWPSTPSSSRPWPTRWPAAQRARPRSVVGDGDDPIALLVYTSGSTGAPKGAIYPEGKVANMWRSAANTHWDDKQGVFPPSRLPSCR